MTCRSSGPAGLRGAAEEVEMLRSRQHHATLSAKGSQYEGAINLMHMYRVVYRAVAVAKQAHVLS